MANEQNDFSRWRFISAGRYSSFRSKHTGISLGMIRMRRNSANLKTCERRKCLTKM